MEMTCQKVWWVYGENRTLSFTWIANLVLTQWKKSMKTSQKIENRSYDSVIALLGISTNNTNFLLLKGMLIPAL